MIRRSWSRYSEKLIHAEYSTDQNEKQNQAFPSPCCKEGIELSIRLGKTQSRFEISPASPSAQSSMSSSSSDAGMFRLDRMQTHPAIVPFKTPEKMAPMISVETKMRM